MTRRRHHATAVLVLSAALAAPGPVARAATGTDLARAWLTKALQDPETTAPALVAFRSIADDHLLGLLIPLSKHTDKRVRLMAIEALGQYKKDQVLAPLLDRLNYDPSMANRAQALVQLLNMDALTARQLVQCLRLPDANLKGISARALIRKGQGTAALATLRDLAKTSPAGKTKLDTAGVAALSRMSLIGLGDTTYLAQMQQYVLDPSTSVQLVELLMEQIAEEKIAAAAPLAQQVAATGATGPIRMMGYKALARVGPKAAETLYNALRTAEGIVLRVHLVHALADCTQPTAYLQAVAKLQTPSGAMARFELARLGKQPKAASAAALEAVKLGHPVLLSYLLDRATAEIEKAPKASTFYAPALLEMIQGSGSDTNTMTRRHVLAAQAAALLTRLNAPAELAALKTILAGRRSARQRAVAAGLRWSKNASVVDLALTVINNPYEDVQIDAAMALGYHGRKEASPVLTYLVQHAARHRPEQVAMACWYLLKIEGTRKTVVAHLAAMLTPK